jgi:YbbR domain-containing protein
MQGEEGLVFRPDVDARKIAYEQTGKIKIPVSTADKNTDTENINVTFNASNMQQLQIDRSTVLSGATRHYTQKELLMMEDMEADLATSINQKKLTERLADDKKQQKLVTEFSAA